MIDRDKLLELLGSEEMADKLIDIFQSEAPGQLAELNSLVGSGDWAAASIVAHSIKSQVAYLGLDQAEYLAREIEEKTRKEADLDSVAELVDDLDSELQSYL
ncbi:MAG: Hpt domain-containing protein [Bacteroidetes bacterium]|nr:Hpt domain-containing protein [Bacteroidota bacterium]